jgi:hypothetical protein
MMVAGARMWLPLITFGAFGMLFTMPILNASSQAIWQRKVEPDLQGRVFSARRVIAWGTSLPAAALGAWLVTGFLQPFMDLDGPMAGSSLASLVELGPGRGISLLMVLTGLLTIIASGVYRLVPAVWHVEDRLPDAVGAIPQADEDSLDMSPDALSGSAEAVTA